MEITSLTNEHIKNVVKLHERKEREISSLFIVEGPHLVKEAEEYGLVKEKYSLEEKEGYIKVCEQVMRKMCETNTLVSELAVCKMIEKHELKDKVLVLDKVQDPGNLGALMRSAVAFGFETIVLGTGTVDIYNNKVIRSSQGAIFKLNFIKEDLVKYIPYLYNNNYQVIGTNVRRGISINDLSINQKFALVLGNEGNGIDESVDKVIKENIYLPLKNTESLNVTVAGSIIMYELSNMKGK